MDLVDERLHVRKTLFGPDSLHESDSDGSVIEVAGKIQQMRFEQMVAAIEGRPDTDVDDGRV